MQRTSRLILKKVQVKDQVYECLKQDILAGRWESEFPGTRTLAAELGVARLNVLSAVKRLESEGFLKKNANGYSKSVFLKTAPVGKRRLEVAVLTRVPLEEKSQGAQKIMYAVLREIESCGFVVKVATPSFDICRNKAAAKNWLNSLEADFFMPDEFPADLLEILLERKVPVFALGGDFFRFPGRLGGVDVEYSIAVAEAIRGFAAAGHTRIVSVMPDIIRASPECSLMKSIRGELLAAGIKPSAFNIPDWDSSPKGLAALLESLFSITPPTALVAWDTDIAAGIMVFLARRRLRFPEDVSLVVCEDVAMLSWLNHEKEIAVVSVDTERLVAPVRRWLESAEHGRIEKKQVVVRGELRRGDGIAPARKSKFPPV